MEKKNAIITQPTFLLPSISKKMLDIKIRYFEAYIQQKQRMKISSSSFQPDEALRIHRNKIEPPTEQKIQEIFFQELHTKILEKLGIEKLTKEELQNIDDMTALCSVDYFDSPHHVGIMYQPHQQEELYLSFVKILRKTDGSLATPEEILQIFTIEQSNPKTDFELQEETEFIFRKAEDGSFSLKGLEPNQQPGGKIAKPKEKFHYNSHTPLSYASPYQQIMLHNFLKSMETLEVIYKYHTNKKKNEDGAYPFH